MRIPAAGGIDKVVDEASSLILAEDSSTPEIAWAVVLLAFDEFVAWMADDP